jgi:hypothetical protein
VRAFRPVVYPPQYPDHGFQVIGQGSEAGFHLRAGESPQQKSRIPVLMPRAYIEMILSSKPVNRVSLGHDLGLKTGLPISRCL